MDVTVVLLLIDWDSMRYREGSILLILHRVEGGKRLKSSILQEQFARAL